MKTRIVALGALLACAPGLALAAAAPDVLLKQEIDRREQERREQRWDERHVPGGAPVLPPSPAGATSGPCFPIRRITVHPGDLLPPARVSAALATYEGRCLGATDLAAVQHALNVLVLDAGLVTTRVVVPEQNLAGGELRLEVWPGVLEALQATALSARELALASPLRPGDLLQLRALEQTVDNLNRLASFQSKVDLKPGEQPGGSVAQLTVQRAGRNRNHCSGDRRAQCHAEEYGRNCQLLTH